MCEENTMAESLERELSLTAKSAQGCTCCAPTGASGVRTERREPKASSMLPAVQAEYRVAGMTCGHCASSVTDALGALDDVSDVQVALVPGGISTVTLLAVSPVSESAVRSAIAGAGYELIAS
jgi:copper chaperone CopZ